MNVIAPALFHNDTGVLEGEGTAKSARKLADLSGVFIDEAARQGMNQDQIVYEVYQHSRCSEGAAGGLFFGVSHVHPGRVGFEYFMTKGHFHAKVDCGEYYWGLAGTGLLVLMDEERTSWAEKVFPGSLHYIPGRVAHRLVNTGEQVMKVGACWPADAGHDYASIQRDGFSVRVLERNGKPELAKA